MKNLKLVFTLALVALSMNLVHAQVPPVDSNNLAIGGYDVVSYFVANKAAKGDAKYSETYKGATYYFTSAKNQKTFKASPAKYLPQVDGYCAWGVAEKEVKFPVNPETFKIVDGKLYLFFNGDFNGQQFNTLNEWNKDETKQLNSIDAAWTKVKGS